MKEKKKLKIKKPVMKHLKEDIKESKDMIKSDAKLMKKIKKGC